jgi:hypothetical protein
VTLLFFDELDIQSGSSIFLKNARHTKTAQPIEKAPHHESLKPALHALHRLLKP